MYRFVILVSALSLAALVSGADVGPTVDVLEVGTNSVLFDVHGGNTVNGKSIKSIYVNYTEVAENGTRLTRPIHQVMLQGGKFERQVNVTGLKPAVTYWFEMYLVNTDGKRGPSSAPVKVLLKPPTPDFSLTHIDSNIVRLNWGYATEATIDNFILGIETQSKMGCGFSLNFTRCYGSFYDYAIPKRGETYFFRFKSHNPSGFSDTVEVEYPYN